MNTRTLSAASKTSLGHAINPRYLELILLPTERCNFRCTYCYESFSTGRMRRPTVDGVKALISNRMQDIDSLSLSWFGGEPLLVHDIVLEIATHAKHACEQAGVRLRGEVTTNASLLSEKLLDKLVRAQQNHFQITLDGWEEGHNKTRCLASGKGTFKRVWASLQMMKRTNFNFSTMVRVHLTPENLQSVKRLISEFKHQFGGDSRFSVFYKAVATLGGKNDAELKTLECSEAEAAITEMKRILDGTSITAPNIADQPDLNTRFICYAARPNSLVVRADGRINKCTVALDHQCNQIGQLRPNGTLYIDNNKLSPWFRGILAANKEALACPLHNWPADNAAQ